MYKLQTIKELMIFFRKSKSLEVIRNYLAWESYEQLYSLHSFF